MGKYGETAVQATRIIREGFCSDPVDAWQQAAARVFSQQPSSQIKSCPKDTFLSLCGAGLVAGVEAGEYTRSKYNKEYALTAYQALSTDPTLRQDPKKLWKVLCGEANKKENSQLDVVCSLWDAGLLDKKTY
jgi:hypothetical protein